MFYTLARTFLFHLDAEKAHHLGLQSLKVLGRVYKTGSKKFEKPIQTPFGKLRNRVGLAAGFDKNGEALWGWESLGFGFVEVGTATPIPQAGNPTPRLFRLPSIYAIINRMGFNNDGSKIISRRVYKAKSEGLQILVGGNIGKNKDTALEVASEDYRLAAEHFAPFCDYLVINVSSPNTPGLRLLQSQAALDEIVLAVRKPAPGIPLFIKVAPDNGINQSDDVVAVVARHKLTGVIVGNTVVERLKPEALSSDDAKVFTEQGGLSGKPALEKNLELAKIYVEKLRLEGKFMVIGVGGIFSKADAQKYLDVGCDLVQIYSGLVYGGPKLVKELSKL